MDDYHHYCYVADGRKSANITLPGVFHTVNPAANDVYPIYKENAREYILLKTKQFGTILMMEVGAMMVGKITNLHKNSADVKKGQEKGNFEFGGSTVILLIQPGKVRMMPAKPCNTQDDLSLAYTPGVAFPCTAIRKDP